MIQETESERYIRLAALIENKDRVEYGSSCTDDSRFTSQERRDIGDILAESMTPWEFSCNIQDVGDVTYSIAEGYASLSSIGLALVYAATDGCESVDDWIRENGLPFPDKDEIIEHLMDNIDNEEYINDNYRDLLDMLPDQCEFNLSDSELIHLFEFYTDEPESDELVICDAATRLECTGYNCYHAVPHNNNETCRDPDCEKHKIKVKCVPVEVE